MCNAAPASEGQRDEASTATLVFNSVCDNPYNLHKEMRGWPSDNTVDTKEEFDGEYLNTDGTYDFPPDEVLFNIGDGGQQTRGYNRYVVCCGLFLCWKDTFL